MFLVADTPSQKPDLLRSRIGDVLRQERKARGKTLEELAKQANVSPSHLSEIERGIKEASSEIIQSIHRSLGMELDDLLQRTIQRPDTQVFAVAA